jgi:long-subunit acyl-CoA synthetase (AMP-forming)
MYRIGRVDDVIVMANGEKAVPGPLEGMLMTSPLVRGVLVFGRERSQLGVLVELAHNTELTDDLAIAALRNTLWSVYHPAYLDSF